MEQTLKVHIGTKVVALTPGVADEVVRRDAATWDLEPVWVKIRSYPYSLEVLNGLTTTLAADCTIMLKPSLAARVLIAGAGQLVEGSSEAKLPNRLTPSMLSDAIIRTQPLKGESKETLVRLFDRLSTIQTCVANELASRCRESN